MKNESFSHNPSFNFSKWIYKKQQTAILVQELRLGDKTIQLTFLTRGYSLTPLFKKGWALTALPQKQTIPFHAVGWKK